MLKGPRSSGRFAALAFLACFPSLLLAAACGAGSPPEISTFAPSQLQSGTAALLIVFGSGFTDGANVTLGHQIEAVRTVWLDAGSVTAILPSTLQPGAEYSVEVTNPDGKQAVSSEHITVVGAAPPVPTPSQPPATATPTPVPSPPPTRRPVRPPVFIPTEAPTPIATQTPPPGVLVPPLFPPTPTIPPVPTPPPPLVQPGPVDRHGRHDAPVRHGRSGDGHRVG